MNNFMHAKNGVGSAVLVASKDLSFCTQYTVCRDEFKLLFMAIQLPRL